MRVVPEVGDQRSAIAQWQVAPLGFATGFEAAFDLVELADACQRDICADKVAVAGLEELATGVSPASDFLDRAVRMEIEAVVRAEGVGLQVAAEVREHARGAVPFARTGEVEVREGMRFIADVGPHAAGELLLRVSIMDLDRRVVCVQHVRGERLRLDQRHQRFEQFRAAGAPVAQRLA